MTDCCDAHQDILDTDTDTEGEDEKVVTAAAASDKVAAVEDGKIVTLSPRWK